MQTMHEGGVSSSRILHRSSNTARQLTKLNALLMPDLGMKRGITHAEYIRDREGRFFFLEAAARVGGAYIAEVIEAATGVNLWAEWAKLEVCALRGARYTPPTPRDDYAGVVLCLARQADPDTSSFTDPEIVHRLHKPHHAGLVVRSPSAERICTLIDSYSQRFAEQYLAVAPPPPTVTQ